MRIAVLLGTVGMLWSATGALAQGTLPQPGPADPRIRTVAYNPDQVVLLHGHLGYQMMIEFDSAERIENVSIGDSTVWQVTPNRKATLLFLKPVDRKAATNMTVVTNLRRYAFQLTASEAMGPDDPDIIFDVRFLYPESTTLVIDVPPPPEPVVARQAPPIDKLNFAYDSSGSKRTAPLRVFDDGAATYFQFPDQAETPAIFALDSSGHESLVNFQVRGRYFVVDAVGQAFALRLGREKTIVKNAGYNAPQSAPAQQLDLKRAAENKP
jgi:type IV secretion system protein VirB9